MNLIGNAVKFTETGGIQVAVSVDTESPAEPRLRIDVIDSGIGMTAAQLESLFQPFAQGDGSTTRGFAGTGLGLSICKRLAQMLGGDVRVQSRPGFGSRFTVTVGVGDLQGVSMGVDLQEATGQSGFAAAHAVENRSPSDAGSTMGAGFNVKPAVMAASPPATSGSKSPPMALEPIQAACIKFLPAFLAHIPKQTEKLMSAVREDDIVQLRRLLHDLKGTCGLFGLREISEKAAQSEKQLIETAAIESTAREIENISRMLRQAASIDPARFPVRGNAAPPRKPPAAA